MRGQGVHVLQSRVLLTPSDFAASVAFYERAVGLTRYREWGAEPHRGVVYFLGGGYLELNESGPPGPARGVRLWLQVADAGKARAELDDGGVTIMQEPVRQPWGLVEMVVTDPDGLELVFVEVPEDHPLRRDTR